MIRLILVLALTLFAPSQTSQQYGISYRLAMPHPASHLFEVTVEVTVPANDPSTFIDFQMPKWQPGRYSAADFAANVQEFSAGSQNRTLTWTKTDDQTWRVQRQGNRSVTATYKVFGDDLSGTYAQLDVSRQFHRWRDLHVRRRPQTGCSRAPHRAAAKLARGQRTHRTIRPARLEVSQLRNHDR